MCGKGGSGEEEEEEKDGSYNLKARTPHKDVGNNEESVHPPKESAGI